MKKLLEAVRDFFAGTSQTDLLMGFILCLIVLGLIQLVKLLWYLF